MSSVTSFEEFGLSDALLRAIAASGYTQPTPIQAQAIPQVLQGGDVLAAAQTGTGKTAGFTLPMLQRLTTLPAPNGAGKPGRPRALVLAPTRELAAQVEECVKSYSQFLPIKSMVMYGGVGMNPQIQALRQRVDILVACPGRLLDHVGQKTLDLSGIEILVLDEADRMLDMGFIHDIRKVLALLPKKRQNLLFSATFSDEIRRLAEGLLDKPVTIEVAARNTTAERVEQGVYLVPQKQKREVLAHLIEQNSWQQVLVFTRTKHGANKLAEYLEKRAIPAAAIHGNKSQSARTKALAQFKDGSLPVLVATDIAARGLDIDELPQVVNFELPNVPEDYVHRIGRTGRAGASGAAVSLVDDEEVKLLKGIERLIKRPIPQRELVGFVPSATPDVDSPAREAQNRPRGGGGRDSRDGRARTDAQHKPARPPRQHGDGHGGAAQPRQNARPAQATQGQPARSKAQNASRGRAPQAAPSAAPARPAAPRPQRQQPALFAPRGGNKA